MIDNTPEEQPVDELDQTEQILSEPTPEELALEEEAATKKALCRVVGTKHPNIERFRLFLMFCACIKMFGAPTWIGSYLQTICGFAPIAFFVLSGFLVLSDPEKRRKRIARAIGRTALVFVLLVIFYTAVNLWLYFSMGVNVLPALSSKRLWFNFVVLNVWPFEIGDAIWYVQALLYTYIILFFLDLTKLLRFDWLICILLLGFAIATGELNGIVKFSFFGYNAFPSNFLNRALPYVLLGGILARNVHVWTFRFPAVYFVGAVLGVGMIIGEPLLLNRLGVPGYYGHLVGMGVVAVCSVVLLFQDVVQRDMDDYENAEVFEFPMSRWNINFIYYLYQPAATLLAFGVVQFGGEFFSTASEYIGLATFAILLFFTFLVGYIRFSVTARRIEAMQILEEEDIL